MLALRLLGYPTAGRRKYEKFSTFCKGPLTWRSVSLKTINQTCFGSLMKQKNIIVFYSTKLHKIILKN